MKLDSTNIKTYLLGASLYACGGGLPRDVAEKIFGNSSIEILPTSSFSNDAILMSVYGIGSLEDTRRDVDFVKLAAVALAGCEGLAGKKCSGLIPGEIGGEASVFALASELALPVVDADLVGGRAAPEVTMDCFSIFEIPVGPCVLALENGKLFVLRKNTTGKEVEAWARTILAQEKSAGVLAGYAQPVSILKTVLPAGTISAAFKAGSDIENGQKPDRAPIVAKGKIEKLDLEDRDGFLTGKAILDDRTELFFQNELLAVMRSGEILVFAPTVLAIMSLRNVPLHTTDLATGQELAICAIEPNKQWQTPEAQKIFGQTYVNNLIRKVEEKCQACTTELS